MQDRYLFRGKRIDDNGCDGEWVIGYHCYIGWTNEEKHYIIPHYSSAFYGLEIDPATVGQCTGLKDKNGDLIFEGDLVTVTGYSYTEPETEASGEIYITPLGCAVCETREDETCNQEYLNDLQGSYTTIYEKYGNIHDKSEVE